VLFGAIRALSSPLDELRIPWIVQVGQVGDDETDLLLAAAETVVTRRIRAWWH
jgi:hypothetical protein